MPPRKLTLIPIGAAAARVGLNHRTIRRYIAEGKLRAYRVGDRLIRVDQADVDALVRPVPTDATGWDGR
jgi:excisionase family DNA binding protein